MNASIYFVDNIIKHFKVSREREKCLPLRRGETETLLWATIKVHVWCMKLISVPTLFPSSVKIIYDYIVMNINSNSNKGG